MNPELITLIINVVLGVFILFGFLGGLKGIKKSTYSLVVFIIELLVIFFISPLVSKMLLNINIGGQTINQMISTAIYDMVGEELASKQFIKNLVGNIPTMIVNLVTTILLLLVLSIIFKIIGAIVYRIIFKKDSAKVIEKCEVVNGTPQMVKTSVKKKKHRLWGGLVGAVHGFLFALAMFLPVCGLINIANDVIGIGTASAETTDNSELKHFKYILQENIPQDVICYLDAINNSIIYKIGNVADISEMSFNLVAKTTINGKNISLGNEIKSLISTYDAFVDFATTTTSTLENNDINSILNDIKQNPDNYDFDMLYSVIDRLFESDFVNTLGNDALKFVADLLVEGAEDDQTLSILNHVKTAIYNYVDSGASLKNDLKAFIGVLEISLKEGLVSTLENESLKLEDVTNILLNKADLANNKPENEVLNKILDKTTSSVLLQKFILEAINFGLEELEVVMENNLEFRNSYEVNLKTINSAQDYSIKSDELEKIIVDGLDLYEKIEKLDTKAIEEDIYVIFDADVKSIIDTAGNILNNFVSMSVFKDTGVFNGLCDAMANTEYSDYIDFNLLKVDNTIETQFGDLAEAVGKFKDSGIIADLREVNDSNLKEKIEDIIEYLAKEDPEGTIVSTIVSPLLKCTIFKPAVEYGLDEAREYLENALKEKNPNTIINKFNTENLMTTEENQNVINVLNNLVQFVGNIKNIDNMLTNKFIDELIENSGSFDNLGIAMDYIKASSLFADYNESGENKDGVYKCILNSLNGMETFNGFFDFSVAKQSEFNWENTTAVLKELTKNLEDIQIGKNSLIKYMLTSSDDYDSLISGIRTWIEEGASEGEERTVELTKLFELDLLKPTSVKLVNLINSTIKDFVNEEGISDEEQLGKYIVDIDLTANIYDQAESINNVINKALVIDFDSISESGIENISDKNLSLINNLLTAMETNAKSTEYVGVFKESYNALLIKVANTVNEEIKSFVGNDLSVGIVNINGDTDITAHKDDIMNIIEKALDIDLASIDIETITEEQKTKLNALLDEIQNNAIKNNSPFAVSYNALLLKTINLINTNIANMVGDAGSEIKEITTPVNISFYVSNVRTILNEVIDMAISGELDEENLDIKTLNVDTLFDFIDLFNNSSVANGAFEPTYNSLLVYIVNIVNTEVANAVGSSYTNYNGTITPDYNKTKTLVTCAVNAFGSLQEDQKIEDMDSSVLDPFMTALNEMTYTQNSKIAIEEYLAGLVTE